MSDQINHDRLLCKIQAFHDLLDQRIREKETMDISLNDADLRKELFKEIEIINRIFVDYSNIFEDILHKE